MGSGCIWGRKETAGRRWPASRSGLRAELARPPLARDRNDAALRAPCSSRQGEGDGALAVHPGSSRSFRSPRLVGLHRTEQENPMPQSTHDRAAELHNLAAHTHAAAAEAHGKSDHLTAHELSKKALEHSRNAYRQSEELVEEAETSSKKTNAA